MLQSDYEVCPKRKRTFQIYDRDNWSDPTGLIYFILSSLQEKQSSRYDLFFIFQIFQTVLPVFLNISASCLVLSSFCVCTALVELKDTSIINA